MVGQRTVRTALLRLTGRFQPDPQRLRRELGLLDVRVVRRRTVVKPDQLRLIGPRGGLNKTQLKDVARALNVPGYSKLAESELRRDIVEATVGRRVDSIATRGFDGIRP